MLMPGDTVVLDTLGSHKVGGLREPVEARAASLLHLPPYSPDLDPIERASSKLERLLRDAAERPVDALSQPIRRLLHRLPAAGCTNDMHPCGLHTQAHQGSARRRSIVTPAQATASASRPANRSAASRATGLLTSQTPAPPPPPAGCTNDMRPCGPHTQAHQGPARRRSIVTPAQATASASRPANRSAQQGNRLAEQSDACSTASPQPVAPTICALAACTLRPIKVQPGA